MNHSQSASLPAIKGTNVISLDWTSAVKKSVIHLTNWVLLYLTAEIHLPSVRVAYESSSPALITSPFSISLFVVIFGVVLFSLEKVH